MAGFSLVKADEQFVAFQGTVRVASAALRAMGLSQMEIDARFIELDNTIGRSKFIELMSDPAAWAALNELDPDMFKKVSEDAIVLGKALGGDYSKGLQASLAVSKGDFDTINSLFGTSFGNTDQVKTFYDELKNAPLTQTEQFGDKLIRMRDTISSWLSPLTEATAAIASFLLSPVEWFINGLDNIFDSVGNIIGIAMNLQGTFGKYY